MRAARRRRENPLRRPAAAAGALGIRGAAWTRAVLLRRGFRETRRWVLALAVRRGFLRRVGLLAFRREGFLAGRRAVLRAVRRVGFFALRRVGFLVARRTVFLALRLAVSRRADLRAPDFLRTAFRLDVLCRGGPPLRRLVFRRAGGRFVLRFTVRLAERRAVLRFELRFAGRRAVLRFVARLAGLLALAFRFPAERLLRRDAAFLFFADTAMFPTLLPFSA